MNDKVNYFRNYSGKGSNDTKKEPAATTAKVPKQQGPRPPTIHLEDDYDDDEPAFERHVKFLQKEFKRQRPDEYTVKELMRKTFKIRRQKIHEAPTRIAELLQVYPPLKSYDHVSIICSLGSYTLYIYYSCLLNF